MTDRSSQPCPSQSNQSSTDDNALEQKTSTRRFTIRLVKKSNNLVPETKENNNDSNNQLNSVIKSSPHNEISGFITNSNTNSKTNSNSSNQNNNRSNTSATNSMSTQETSNQTMPTTKPIENKPATKALASIHRQKTTTITNKAKQNVTLLERVSYPSTHKPAINHAYFDASRPVIDPARPLTDIPEPAPRYEQKLQAIYQSNSEEDTRIAYNDKQTRLANNVTTKSKSITNTVKEDSLQSSTTQTVIKQPSSQSNILSSKQVNQKIRWGESSNYEQDLSVSKWQLIQSPELADHLSLLTAGKLAKLPTGFYQNHSKQPLLPSLSTMKIVDMAEIQSVLTLYPNLTRQGFVSTDESDSSSSNNKDVQSYSLHHLDEMHNLALAYFWEAILYPQRFDQGLGNLSTDVMAISIAVHSLSQCSTRQSINDKITANKLVEYIRSYVLSQCRQLPRLRDSLTHTPIYVGHVIVAAQILGWEIQITETKDVLFNVSSRCGLFARYPILSDYFVAGWE